MRAVVLDAEPDSLSKETLMIDLNVLSSPAQPQRTLPIEQGIEACRAQFNHLLSEVLTSHHQEAHVVEASIFKQLMQLGLLLLHLFFLNHHQGDYGKTLQTAQGLATRERPSERAYFSIFGKLQVERYLYSMGSISFAPLDQFLNLPVRCYSYFLAERVNLLDIQGSYAETVSLLHRFFDLKLSVSAAETISQESASLYQAYDEEKPSPGDHLELKDYTVASFDGKGVPMIKAEATKIKGRQGKGEKKQKKKEALVGVAYTTRAHVRRAEEVATHLVFPEESSSPSPSANSTEVIRYLASVERPKKEVMHDIKQEIEGQSFAEAPLICVMDGAKCLWTYVEDVFKNIKNKVLILDIIHVLEYIWLMAHVKYEGDDAEAKQYAYDKLLLILQGKVSSYILELQNELMSGLWNASQQKTFKKVITYLKNHKSYMKYHEYLAHGYPIGSGVVESACSQVVKNRMELPGARWSVSGAEAILQLRSVVKSQDWDAYWAFYTSHIQQPDYRPPEVNSLNLQLKIPA
jgi:hypothetical protein